eukprot:1712609-Alexandrium_andersonii.AAC.1
MSASLVGSEMCIRDRVGGGRTLRSLAILHPSNPWHFLTPAQAMGNCRTCLLYTSDAADDM